jgi:hypothetical protein
MEQYFTYNRKTLQNLVASHAAPKGSHEVTATLNFVSGHRVVTFMPKE